MLRIRRTPKTFTTKESHVLSEPEGEQKLGWFDDIVERSAKDLRSPVTAASFLLALAAVPTILGWIYPTEAARLLIHYDPFTVYDPGKPLGTKIRYAAPPIDEGNSLQSTVLPNPPIKLLTLEGKVINTPVFDMELSIWNGGSEPINRDKIRRPLVISFPHVDSLLGIRVLHENPNDGLKVVTQTLSPASLVLSWDYLDVGKGFKLAVVFASPGPLYPPEINSYIAGHVIDTNRTIPGLSWRSGITTLSLAAFVSLFFVSALGTTKRHRRLLSLVLPLLVVAASFIFAYFTTFIPTPPF